MVDAVSLGGLRRVSFPQLSTSPNLIASSSGTQIGATPIHNAVNLFTQVGGVGYSSILPPAEGGRFVTVANGGTNALNVYPNSTDQINALSASAAYSLAAGTTVTFYCPAHGKWFSVSSGSGGGGGGGTETGGVISSGGSSTVSSVTAGSPANRVVTTTSAVTINIPAPTPGAPWGRLNVSDQSGNPNITITPASGLINGASSATVTTAYGSISLIDFGTGWAIQ